MPILGNYLQNKEIQRRTNVIHIPFWRHFGSGKEKEGGKVGHFDTQFFKTLSSVSI